jgi:hypothetical protein
MLLANAVGLLIAALLLPGFTVNLIGFLTSVVFFTTVELLFEPFIMKMAIRYLPAIRGGIALVTTFVGLLLTSMFTAGVEISGVTTWVLAPLIIWVSVLLAGILLPLVLFKNILREGANARSAKKEQKLL